MLELYVCMCSFWDAISLPYQKIYENGSVEPSSKNVYPGANQFKVNGRLFLSATVLDDEVQSSSDSIDETSMDRCQDIVVHFYSTVCRCILRADVPDIVFDDCVPGGVFVKDFSIWNLSEIPCAFQIHVKNGQAEQPVRIWRFSSLYKFGSAYHMDTQGCKLLPFLTCMLWF